MANPRRKKKKPVDNYKPPFDKKILEEPIESLKFKVDNTLELLKSGGLRNLGDIVRREEKDFYKIFKFKKRNLIDVIKAIKPKKLYLKPSQKETAESTPQPKEKKATSLKAPADIYVKFNKGGSGALRTETARWSFHRNSTKCSVTKKTYAVWKKTSVLVL